MKTLIRNSRRYKNTTNTWHYSTKTHKNAKRALIAEDTKNG